MKYRIGGIGESSDIHFCCRDILVAMMDGRLKIMPDVSYPTRVLLNDERIGYCPYCGKSIVEQEGGGE